MSNRTTPRRFSRPVACRAATLAALTGVAIGLAHAEPVPGRAGRAQPANQPDTQPASQPTSQPTTQANQSLSVQVEPVPETPRDHDPAAIALLDQAERAIAEVNSFRATLKVDGTQVFSGTTDEGSASILALRSPDEPQKWLVRITGPITPERGTRPIDIDATFNGVRMKWLDHDDRSVGARELPMRMLEPWFAVPDRLRAKLWISPNPFASERASERLTLEARETVDGVECEVLRAQMAGGTSYYRLFLGVADHLPRRAVRGFDSRGGSLPMVGTEVVDYTSLTTDVDLSPDDFVLKHPEGYRIEQFPDEARAMMPPISPDAAAAIAASRSEGGLDGEGQGALQFNVPIPPGAIPPNAATRSGDLAPDFDLNDLQGQVVRLSSLRGQPVVLLFWGSWNPWATKLARELRAIHDENPDLKILVLAVRERSPDKMRQSFGNLGLTATLLGSADDAAARYDVAAVPTLVLVDADGRIRLRHAGFNASNSPIPALREALAGD